MFSQLVANQRNYFQTGITREEAWRINQLKGIVRMLTDHSSDFKKALWRDLRRNSLEADLLDIEYVVKEANYMQKHLPSWMRSKSVHTPLSLIPSKGAVHRDPLGTCLILGTWNYPVMLTLAPLAAAIAGGNTAIVKPSELAQATSDVLSKFIPLYLDRNAVSIVCGGPLEASALLEERFDHIFFTGNGLVGKRVMTAAARHLTPVVLELGGKNPCVVHSSANLRVAARRIAQGRWINAGQTCTAPDYLLVFKEVKNEFLKHLKAAIIEFYGENPRLSPDYGRIVDIFHFDRLVNLLGNETVYHGGNYDAEDLFIAPTILVDVKKDAPIMQEEIFGPLLPILEVSSIEECIDYININSTPLGLYIFAEDKEVGDYMVKRTRSGGVCSNDCSIEPLIKGLPFGGVGGSGIGKYHGEWGFLSYTQARAVLNHGTAFDLSLRYPPYSSHTWLRKIMKKLLSYFE